MVPPSSGHRLPPMLTATEIAMSSTVNGCRNAARTRVWALCSWSASRISARTTANFSCSHPTSFTHLTR